MIEISIDQELTLLQLRDDDAEHLLCLIDKNRGYLRQWLPWLDANTELAHSQAYIATTEKQYLDKLGFSCGIWYLNTLVGVCSYHPVVRANQSVSLGYWLNQEHQGLGLVTRCAKALIDYAFTTLDLNKVCIHMATGNKPSLSVAQRLGLVYEGTERDAEFLYDHYVDHFRYSTLKKEWSL